MNRRSLLLAAACPVLASHGPATAQAAAPRPPDVSLLDDAGRSVSLRALLARHTVAINFIFTGCLSFCPPQTAVFREVQRRLGELGSGSAYPPLLLSISLDALNDTPQALAQYAAKFEARLGLPARWLMLTGDASALRDTARAFGAGTERLDDHPAQLWVGCMPRAHWRNAAGLAAPDDVLRLLRAASA
jgi:protein SCO1